MDSQKEILDFAKKLALEAGNIAKKAFFSESFKSSMKKDSSAVTEVDLKVEKYLSKKISGKFPKHELLGEEFGAKKGTTGKWYIDPIDGTNNFAKHIPFFTVSIAFECPSFSAGVVYAPITDELFYATTGKGGYLNGRRLTPAFEKKPISACYFGICHNKDKEVLDIALPFFVKMKQQAHDAKKLGSASLEICYVACNRIDGFIGFDLGLWDFKGAEIIAKEAGAHVSSIAFQKSRKIPAILVCNPHLKQSFISEFAQKKGGGAK